MFLNKSKSIKKQLLFPIIIITFLLSIVIYNFLILKNEENIVSSTINFSKNSLDQYKYLRQYYNHEIITVLHKHTNAQIDVLAQKEEGTIPLPATMMQELSSYINKQDSGIKVKFYSNYPFPIRQGRVLDEFEKKSIDFLEKNKNDVYSQRSIYNGEDSVRVAIADIFSNPSCVNCHNAMDSSPKRDWQLNDVGGVLEMIVSIEDMVEKNKENTFHSTLIIFMFLVVLVFLIYLLINSNILKPLYKIIQHILLLEKGDLDHQLNLKKDNELDVLCLNIDSMRRSLKETILSLEQTKKELEDSNDELEVSLDNLQKTQEKLIEAEKMASLGTLVAGVAHEINTPIGIGLTGMSHLLKQSNDLRIKYDEELMAQEDFEDYMKESIELGNLIYSNLQRTADLVKSFKQVSVDQVSEEKREFNLKKYMNGILLSLSSITKKTNLKIDVDIDANINVTSYPGVLSQIITNFIINTKIHGFNEGDSGNIRIVCEKVDKKIRLVYEDDGKGIETQSLRKIFDPFYTTNRQKGGTGLGLHIVYNLVRSKLHGTIICESAVDEYTRFIIEFKSEN